jgi:signal peptidase II
MQRSDNGRLFWPVLIGIAVADAATKIWAVASLQPERVPQPVIGEWVRFTLVYNPGAAFGLHLGEHSRWIFMVLTIFALLILGRLYQSTRSGHQARVFSLALVCGGAIGNLMDRIRVPKGVVDFIDVGLADSRWPTFNVADMAVSVGAFLLAWVLWGEETESERDSLAVAAPAAVAPGAAAAGSSQEIS